MNALGGVTLYDGFPFKSFGKANRQHFGCNVDGIFLLEGDSDDGEEISWSWSTHISDMGNDQLKRVPRAYIGYTASGPLSFSAIGSSDNLERSYSVPMSVSTGFLNQRIPLAAGVISRYWQFGLSDTKGSSFELDSLTLDIKLSNRRYQAVSTNMHGTVAINMAVVGTAWGAV